MKKIAASLTLLASAVACAQPRSAGPLTVEVFSTRAMQRVTVIPVSARDSMRLCAACAQNAVTGPLRFQIDSAGALTLNGTRLRVAELNGDFRAGDDTGRVVSDGREEAMG